MKGLVRSGRYGTCLRPLAHAGQKQLIPVAYKPNMQHIIAVHRNPGMTDNGINFGKVIPMAGEGLGVLKG